MNPVLPNLFTKQGFSGGGGPVKGQPMVLAPVFTPRTPAYQSANRIATPAQGFSGGNQAQSRGTIGSAPGSTLVSGGATGGGITGTSTTPSNLYSSGLKNILSSSDLAAQNANLGETTSINDYIDTVKQQQKNIDAQRVQDYLAKQSGNQSITDWVGRGIRSGGVTLGNKNASNSSAADAYARAFSTLGRQQAAGVNEQFANSEDQQNQAQQALKADMAAHIRDLPAWKTQTVNSIVSDAQQQLAQLNLYLQYTNSPDRVDIETQKQAIAANAINKLQDVDAALASVNNVQPSADSDIVGRANTLFQAGTAPESPFNFSTNAPISTQNTGPFASELPIFTYPTSTKKSQ